MPGNPWKGATAVVCGASAGLGRNLAVELARQGLAHLIIVARQAAPLDELTEQLRRDCPETRCVAYPVDATSAEDMRSLGLTLQQQELRIDLLIQAVGQSDRGELQALDPHRLDQLWRANVVTSLNALQAFLPVMASPRGTVVFIGSLASRLAPRYLGGYSMAKHALSALAGQARLELASRGIHVMLACPGPIARPDAGRRYAEQASVDRLPPGAQRPGGGARLPGLDPEQLSREILDAAARRQPEIIRPRKVRLLLILNAISPKLGDWLLRRRTS